VLEKEEMALREEKRVVAWYPILCLNSGSSSLKFSLYQLGEVETLLATGAVERIGLQGGMLWVKQAGEETVAEVRRDFPTHDTAVEATFHHLERLKLSPPVAVGHRLVHGGPDYTTPMRVDALLLDTLRELIAFAPLHLPSAIQGIETVAQRFPGLPQVACFDTAFHRRMPEVAQRLPLPRDLWDEGIRRYGFHGLSYEYIVETLGPAARGRTLLRIWAMESAWRRYATDNRWIPPWGLPPPVVR
jgi:acetate kinase